MVEFHSFYGWVIFYYQRRQWHPTPVLLPGKSHGQRSLVAAVHGVSKSWTRLSDFTFTFHFHALEKELATHSSVLAWRIPETGEPGGLPSMGSHRVGHDWSDLAAAAGYSVEFSLPLIVIILLQLVILDLKFSLSYYEWTLTAIVCYRISAGSCPKRQTCRDGIWEFVWWCPGIWAQCWALSQWGESESRSVVSSSLWPHGLYSPWNSPGQNIGVGSLSLLQGIFPTQELCQGFLHWKQIFHQLSYKGIDPLS